MMLIFSGADDILIGTIRSHAVFSCEQKNNVNFSCSIILNCIQIKSKICNNILGLKILLSVHTNVLPVGVEKSKDLKG